MPYQCSHLSPYHVFASALSTKKLLLEVAHEDPPSPHSPLGFGCRFKLVDTAAIELAGYGAADFQQYQAEQLVSADFDSLQSGSSVVMGVPFDWSVTGTDTKRVALVAIFTNGLGDTVKDTTIILRPDPTP